MPLDLDCTDPMYLLGRAIATIEGAWPQAAGSRVSDGPILDTLLVYPAKGFAMLRKRFGQRMTSQHVAPIIEILPSELPRGPVPIEQQGAYWMGYYHQRGQDQRDYNLTKKFTPDIVINVGETLFGPDHWQAEMARALRLSDSSRVRDWIRDNEEKRRRVPPGICRDLLAMLRQKSAEAKALALAIEKLGEDD